MKKLYEKPKILTNQHLKITFFPAIAAAASAAATAASAVVARKAMRGNGDSEKQQKSLHAVLI